MLNPSTIDFATYKTLESFPSFSSSTESVSNVRLYSQILLILGIITTTVGLTIYVMSSVKTNDDRK